MLDLAALVMASLVMLGSGIGHTFGAGVRLGIFDGDVWGLLRDSSDSGSWHRVLDLEAWRSQWVGDRGYDLTRVAWCLALQVQAMDPVAWAVIYWGWFSE